mmetsp:Transcript_51458/g.166872  ORF Transcript_51458/g.166872 Transcript_51458/m.166872 type:complete len:416 (-) Transcript_51458:220-1467(-)
MAMRRTHSEASDFSESHLGRMLAAPSFVQVGPTLLQGSPVARKVLGDPASAKKGMQPVKSFWQFADEASVGRGSCAKSAPSPWQASAGEKARQCRPAVRQHAAGGRVPSASPEVAQEANPPRGRRLDREWESIDMTDVEEVMEQSPRGRAGQPTCGFSLNCRICKGTPRKRKILCCYRCRQECASFFDHACPKCRALVCVDCFDEYRHKLEAFRCPKCSEETHSRPALQQAVWLLDGYRSAEHAVGNLASAARTLFTDASTDNAPSEASGGTLRQAAPLRRTSSEVMLPLPSDRSSSKTSARSSSKSSARPALLRGRSHGFEEDDLNRTRPPAHWPQRTSVPSASPPPGTLGRPVGPCRTRLPRGFSEDGAAIPEHRTRPAVEWHTIFGDFGLDLGLRPPSRESDSGEPFQTFIV